MLDSIVSASSPADHFAQVPVPSSEVRVGIAKFQDGLVRQGLFEHLSGLGHRSGRKLNGWHGRVGRGYGPGGKILGAQVNGLEEARLVDDERATDGDVARASPDVLLLGVLG